MRRVRQQLAEGEDALGVEALGGWELPDQGAELLLERKHAGSEEVRERDFHVLELLVVRDEAAALQREAESPRRLRIPGSVGLGRLQRSRSPPRSRRLRRCAGAGASA